MSDSKELKRIKKLYGENFMHLCKSLFPTLLEKEGLLTEVLKSSFATNSRTLCEDIINSHSEETFKNYIYSKVDVEKETPEIFEEKTPYQILDENGYNLYECNSEEEIQSFKKYYKPGEELCTFRGGRLNSCIVFWAVKKNAEEIKREDFDNPKREDEYGTSVMGIQFTKSQNSTVSIKNRYNHKVNNPDATYGNDLDRIAPGLTQSFEKLLLQRGMTLNKSNIEAFNIPGYVVAGDGKYYKYNMEVNGKYYCPGNVIIDNGKVNQLEPEKQELIDYFILDKENKTLSLYDTSIEDSFIDSFKKIDSIEMVNDKESKIKKKIITIKEKKSNEPITIEINKDNNIIGYRNENLIKLGNNFLKYNNQLSEFVAPNAKKIGDEFLICNKNLSKFIVPNVKDIGNDVLANNEGLKKFEAPNVVKIGNGFLQFNKQLSKFIIPNVTDIGDSVLANNKGLKKFEAPNAVRIGYSFLWANKQLSEFVTPNLTDENKEKLEHIFSVVEKNSEKEETQNINSTDIAKLDKESQITTSELSSVKKVINRIKTLFKNKEKEQR